MIAAGGIVLSTRAAACYLHAQNGKCGIKTRGTRGGRETIPREGIHSTWTGFPEIPLNVEVSGRTEHKDRKILFLSARNPALRQLDQIVNELDLIGLIHHTRIKGASSQRDHVVLGLGKLSSWESPKKQDESSTNNMLAPTVCLRSPTSASTAP